MVYQDKRQNTIWVLTDNRPGNVTQALGVANAMGIPFTIKQLVYSKLSFLPSVLWGDGLRGVTEDTKALLQPPWPQLIIAAGRRQAAAALALKKLSGGKIKIVQLMNPQGASTHYDFIFLPEHDKSRTAANIFRTFGTPHQLTEEKLKAAGKFWQSHFVHLPRPWIALLVGGGSRAGSLTLPDLNTLTTDLNQFVGGNPGSLLITTSRRTSPDVAAFFDDHMTMPKYVYEWGQSPDNPYLGMLALADLIVVTGDSMAMCSEACSTGKPVYIFNPQRLVGKKHKRFHDSLFKHGFAKPFADLARHDKSWRPQKLSTAHQVAHTVLSEIKRSDPDCYGQLIAAKV